MTDAPVSEKARAGYVRVHVEPVTVENLRKFAAMLNSMADKLEPAKEEVRAAIRADLERGYSLRQCASRNNVGVGVVRGIRAILDGEAG
jgi:hypothetical protein